MKELEIDIWHHFHKKKTEPQCFKGDFTFILYLFICRQNKLKCHQHIVHKMFNANPSCQSGDVIVSRTASHLAAHPLLQLSVSIVSLDLPK